MTAIDPTRAQGSLPGVVSPASARPREHLVADAAAGDPIALQELHALISADPHASAALQASSGLSYGQRVGAWRIECLIGEGGMGQVWLARRDDGQFEQRVALKCMRFALPEFASRFALERSALARLDHADIARLIDAGVEGGRPWFAMEYVDGRSLRDWAVGRDLTDRVALLARIARAVHAAHMRLVVHRDLKPSNILVTAGDEPKLVDFGIAKLLDHTHGDLTQGGPQPFTPDYASPEQRRGETISTASDIYALGVIGHELFAGRRPPAGDRTPLPSSLCSEPWRDRLVGDLDQVLLRALAASPSDRYASATAFADDLTHWLAGDPVSARAPSGFERLRRYVSRHRALTLAIAATLLAIIGGGATALWQARAARAAEQVAIAERDKAEAVRGFLEHMLAAADPRRESREVTVAQVLEGAERTLDETFAGQPRVAAEISRTLAVTWRGLGRPAEALRNAERAVALFDFGGGSDDERAAALRELAQNKFDSGDLEAAAKHFDAALSLVGDAPEQAETRADLYNDRAVLKRQLGDLDGAQRDYAGALAGYRAAGSDARHIGSALNNLAVLAGTRGDLAGATKLHRDSVAILEAELPANHPDVAEARLALAGALEIEGQFAEADRLYASALPTFAAGLGPDHPKLIQARSSYAWLALRLDDPAKAMELTDAAVAAAGRTLGPEHPLLAYALAVRGEAAIRLGRYADGVRDAGAALDIRRKILPAGHWLIANTENLWAFARLRNGDQSARALLLDSHARLRQALGPEHEVTQRAQARLDALDPRATTG